MKRRKSRNKRNIQTHARNWDQSVVDVRTRGIGATLASNGTWWQDSFVARERYCLFTAFTGSSVSQRPRESGNRLQFQFPRAPPPPAAGTIRPRSPFYRSLRPRHSSLISGTPHEYWARRRRRRRRRRRWISSERGWKSAEGSRRSTVTRSSNPWPDWKLYRDQVYERTL